MSKNYKVIRYRKEQCPPCETMGLYPASASAVKGYEYESVTVTSYSHDPLKPEGLSAYPWFVLQDRDISSTALTSITDPSIVDSFYGGSEARFNILINK
jgi:hypothetical protein